MPLEPRARRRIPRADPRGSAGTQEAWAKAAAAPSDVQHVIELVPQQCKGGGHRLVGKDCEPHCHQVVEVPRLSAIVTEYCSHTSE